MNSNKKRHWGIVLGVPTPKHPDPKKYLYNSGKWMGYTGVSRCWHVATPYLFYTRSEAEAKIRELRSPDDKWTHLAKKITPNDKPRG
jgi:hypothetical protein